MTAVKVSRILHAGYVLEFEGQQIAFDPLFENPFSKNCYAFPEISFDLKEISKLRFSAVFISHFHDDHCSLDSLSLLDRRTPIYLFCIYPELFEMIKGLGFQEVHSLDLEIPVEQGPFKVIPHRALDADVDCLYEIQVGGQSILNVVDSWIDQAMLQKLAAKAPWDLVMWPFQSMRELEVISPKRALPSNQEIPPEHKQQLISLGPRYLVPSSCQFKQESWSWYNQAFFPISYRAFTEQVCAIFPNTVVQRMEPGRSFLLSDRELQRTEGLHWILPQSDGESDYQYDPFLTVPSAQEVSKNFSELKSQQLDQVTEFCERDILERFKSFTPWQTEYFEKSKIWNLRLHFRSGQPKNYFYRIDDESLVPVGEGEAVEWLTEISATKLFSALTSGETLTSLYLRINDCEFSGTTETQIASVDIGEDPLIRTLFSGDVLGYQKNQYKRLVKSEQLSD
jgi:hypothetical protein